MANSRIPDLWPSAFLLFPDRYYKPRNLLLTSSYFLPPHLFFHILAWCLRPQDSTSLAWLLARRYLHDTLTQLDLCALVPTPHRLTSLIPNQSHCFWTLHLKWLELPFDKWHLPPPPPFPQLPQSSFGPLSICPPSVMVHPWPSPPCSTLATRHSSRKLNLLFVSTLPSPRDSNKGLFPKTGIQLLRFFSTPMFLDV